MATPNFLFGYQEHLISSAFSAQYETAQKYTGKSRHHQYETRVSRDAQNVCAVTKVGTVLKPQYQHTNSPHYSHVFLMVPVERTSLKSRHFIVVDHLFYSHDLYAQSNSHIVRRNFNLKILITNHSYKTYLSSSFRGSFPITSTGSVVHVTHTHYLQIK